MIPKHLVDRIAPSLEDLMISSDKVAHVSDFHSLSHAMLVLSSVKYSMIPVLSADSKYIGLLNMAVIVNAMTQLDGLDPEILDKTTVREVMLPIGVSVTLEDEFEKIFHHLVDYNFLGVVDHQQVFVGIITRRHLLKRLNAFFHDQT